MNHTISRLLNIFCLSILMISCSSKSQLNLKGYDDTDINKDSIDNFLQSKMKEYMTPGVSFAIINKGEVVYHKGLGYANLEKKIPVTDKTIFEGASISKSVFGFFVMHYVEEGKLDLDKPLYEYLPYEDLAYDERYKKITARMVLSHRSGMPNWRENEKDKKLALKFEPGTSFEYSGEGYQYLALVLRHLEGGDWSRLETAFQQKIAMPLRLENTVFIQNDYTKQHKSEAYNGKGKWIDLEKNYWFQKDKETFVAASSIHTNPLDFSKWIIAMMNKEQLSEKSYAELLGHHSKLNTSEGGVTLYYSFGLVTGDKESKNIFFHSGSNDGFTCFYLLDIEKDRGYVLFTNGEHGAEIGEQLFSYLGGADF